MIYQNFNVENHNFVIFPVNAETLFFNKNILKLSKRSQKKCNFFVITLLIQPRKQFDRIIFLVEQQRALQRKSRSTLKHCSIFYSREKKLREENGY